MNKTGAHAANENLHKGHRKRVRERFLAEGGESFEDHQLLEMLLFNCVPLKDTNELAHELLNEFGGSLLRLFQADPREIMKRCRVSEGIAIFLSAQLEMFKRFNLEYNGKKHVINTTPLAGEYAMTLMEYDKSEKFYVICLDSGSRILNSVLVSKGTVNETVVSKRKIVETVLQNSAAFVMLVHNHPGGTIEPSKDDLKTTKILIEALKCVNVPVVDHIIVGEHKYFSFAENGMIEILQGNGKK